MLSFSLKLVTPVLKIRKDILKCYVDELNRVFLSSSFLTRLKNDVKVIVANAIKSSPTYQELASGGQLVGELGIIEANVKISNILDIIINNQIEVTIFPFRISGLSVTGGYKIEAVKLDWSEIVGDVNASYITEKGQQIPWLHWLLTLGDNIIIQEHLLVYNPIWSRTSTFTMRKTPGRMWKMPSAHSGTVADNFITRAIDTCQPEIERLIIRSVS